MAEFLMGLRAFLALLCLGIFTLVFGLMLVSVWRRHRDSGPHQSNFHDYLLVEICWALAPVVVVGLLIWPTVKALWG